MCTSHSRPPEAVTLKAVPHHCTDMPASLQWHGQALGTLHSHKLNLYKTVAKFDTHPASEAMAFSLSKALEGFKCALVSGSLSKRIAVQ